MIITLRNESPEVSSDELEAGVHALNRQISEHLAPAWDVSGCIQIEDPDNPVENPEATLTLTHQESYESYHWDKDRTPAAYVDTEITAWQRRHIPWIHWTVACSHEVLEMLVDPHLDRTTWGPHPTQDRLVKYSMEICDPVQTNMYEIDGVSVINFVLPPYYDVATPVGPTTNFLGEDIGPFRWGDHGQVGYWDPEHDDKWVIYPRYLADAPAAIRNKLKGMAHRLIGYGHLAEQRAAR